MEKASQLQPETVAPTAAANTVVQCTLTVGAANDPLEQEADAVADRVMRMPVSSSRSINTGDVPSIRRKCAHCEEEQAQRKPLAADIQRKGSEGGMIAPDAVTNQINRTRGSGSNMDTSTQSFMESRFGTDFSGVNIHTGDTAVQMSRDLNARAFTVGNDIYFNQGEYNPGSDSGRHLLAHELTHTVQQGSAQSKIQRMIKVHDKVELDTMGYTVSKNANYYTCPRIAKNAPFTEIFTALLHSERIFTIKGTTSAEANANLRRHIAAREGIIDFASKKKYTFGAGSRFKMSDDFWQQDASLEVLPGKDRAKAIKDLNIHPENYQIACLAATELTMEGGSGSRSFNLDESSDIDDWVPGDWGYITNTLFSESINGPGYEGENLIYTGKNKFWGHFGAGNTYKTLAEWMAEVNSWKNSKAELSTQRTYTQKGLD